MTMLSRLCITLTLVFSCVTGEVLRENHVTIVGDEVSFKCKSTETPIWLEKSKDIRLAIGTKKRTTFTNDRLVIFLIVI